MNLPDLQYDIEKIQSLSEKGYVAKAIALALGVKDINLFMLNCTDANHPVGRAYQTGQLEIERKKNDNLLDKVEDGSETAIQIHDKKQRLQQFKDAKNDIFSGI